MFGVDIAFEFIGVNYKILTMKPIPHFYARCARITGGLELKVGSFLEGHFEDLPLIVTK